MKKTAFFLLTCLLPFIIACGGSSIPKDTFVSGSVAQDDGPVVGKTPVVVILFNNDKLKENEYTLKTTVSSETNWKYNINVPYGRYLACAFIDDNKDGAYSMGERWGCNNEMANIAKASRNATRDIIITKR